MNEPTNLFKPIGEIAQDTEARPDVDDDDVRFQEGGDFHQGNEQEVEQTESLCMECHEQGVTRMLLTSIPYFREVIIMSFRCEHCGNSNTEIQSAGEIQPKGCVYSVHILNAADLNRQLVKSNTCTITIPEISLTLPASRGQLTNVEGLVSDIVRDLSLDQPVRKIMDPETHDKIETLLNRLKECLDDDDAEQQQELTTEASKPKSEKTFTPFTLKLDDPSGNSYVQFFGTTSDAQWSLRAYNRTREQNVQLGLVAEEEESAAKITTSTTEEPVGAIDGSRPSMVEREDGTVVPEEVYSFPGACSSCGHQIDTLMQKVNIPHFKDIIIMSTNCEYCGYRDNEVKAGGAIPQLGKKIILKVEDEEDLSRDLLKSETCGLEIPEIDLILQPGTLGGRFTTMEGLLQQVYEELSTKVFHTGGGGDSSVTGPGDKNSFTTFLGSLKQVMAASRPFTLILDDPVANSYLQNIYAPDDDPNMEIITYERTHEQNEELGINDMVLTGYENEHPEAEATEVGKTTEA